jgi:hypothetical protein
VGLWKEEDNGKGGIIIKNIVFMVFNVFQPFNKAVCGVTMFENHRPKASGLLPFYASLKDLSLVKRIIIQQQFGLHDLLSKNCCHSVISD